MSNAKDTRGFRVSLAFLRGSVSSTRSRKTARRAGFSSGFGVSRKQKERFPKQPSSRGSSNRREAA